MCVRGGRFWPYDFPGGGKNIAFRHALLTAIPINIVKWFENSFRSVTDLIRWISCIRKECFRSKWSQGTHFMQVRTISNNSRLLNAALLAALTSFSSVGKCASENQTNLASNRQVQLLHLQILFATRSRNSKLNREQNWILMRNLNYCRGGQRRKLQN